MVQVTFLQKLILFINLIPDESDECVVCCCIISKHGKSTPLTIEIPTEPSLQSSEPSMKTARAVLSLASQPTSLYFNVSFNNSRSSRTRLNKKINLTMK